MAKVAFILEWYTLLGIFLSSLPVCEVVECSCELVSEYGCHVAFEYFYGDVP